MTNMKRLLLLLLAAALCLSLCACGGDDTPAETPAPAPETEAPEVPAKEAPAAETPAPPPEPTPEPAPEEVKPDFSAFAGCWKYDAKPFYLAVEDSGAWRVVNLYGTDVGTGVLEADGDAVTLIMNGTPFTTLRRIVGGISDADGNLLTAADEMMLLPSPNDPLDRSISFSGDYSAVTVSYPHTMTAHARSDFQNGLSFNAALEKGTDDYYSNILIAYMPINGYDPYMTQGAALAQRYMKDMMDKMAKSCYGDKLLQCFGSDFKDCGSYYSMTGYLWLDGGIFDPGPSQPVRGCMEVRYYGPTGYALVAMTVALESRIMNYYEICSKMMESCNYDGMWSTSPKQVPAKPAQQSDSGDYGTPYYWYDSDGDVWYWNGYYNEFIGFGDDYYIDDDGQYYESNDDGWDWDYGYYDDYDPWSDPGDSWDDWSDPGDTWDDWSDPGDTWDW